jgi:hypothetical protein
MACDGGSVQVVVAASRVRNAAEGEGKTKLWNACSFYEKSPGIWKRIGHLSRDPEAEDCRPSHLRLFFAPHVALA